MTIRFCPRCATDVEDAGGFCLLGHRLALDPPAGTMEDLRAEIDRAFEEAQLEVAAVMTTDDEPTAPMPVVTRRTDVGPAPDQRRSPSAPVTSEKSPPTTRRARPPPPPPPRRVGAPSSNASSAASLTGRTTPPVAVPASAQRPPAPPAPPSAPYAGDGQSSSVFKDLDVDVDIAGDPIGAFAPPPHMDWGPDKAKGLKRKPARRSRRAVDAAE